MKTKSKLILIFIIIFLCLSCEGNLSNSFERMDTPETIEFIIPSIFHGAWYGVSDRYGERDIILTEAELLSGSGEISESDAIKRLSDVIIQTFDGESYEVRATSDLGSYDEISIIMTFRRIDPDTLLLIAERQSRGIIDIHDETILHRKKTDEVD